jgi:hypothetical protein
LIKKSINAQKKLIKAKVLRNNLTMTEKEVIEIVQESNLWESLTQNEQQEAINHALKITLPYSEKGENKDCC